MSEPTDADRRTGPTDAEHPTKPTDADRRTGPTDAEHPTGPRQPTDAERPTGPRQPTDAERPTGLADAERRTKPTDADRRTGPADAEHRIGPTDAERRIMDDLHRRLDAEAAVQDEPYVPLASEGPVGDTPMWLSHHWPDQYERCAVVAGRHVCRRCLVLYPIALLAGIVASIGPWWPRAADAWLIPLLPLPAVIEFVADNLGLVRYSPRRQVVLTAIGGIAAGAGYLRYLDRPGDPLVWGTVLAYGAVCLVAAVVAHRRRPA